MAAEAPASGESRQWRAEFLRALGEGDVDAARALLARDDCEHITLRDLRHLKSQACNSEVVGLLSEYADVIEKSSRDAMALFAAARKGKESVEQSLKNGASIDARTEDGGTALHVAAIRSTPEAMQVLLDCGANVDATNKDGGTALHIAASRGSRAAANVLLQKSANVNAALKDGSTPLHIAAKRGHFGLVEVLLAHGAHEKATTKSGFDALHLLYSGQTKDDKPSDDLLQTARLLISLGLPVPPDSSTDGSTSERHSGLLAAIRGWVKERDDGAEELTVLPSEVVARGSFDVQAYFNSVGDADLYRKKLCVIGPSQWGKTSFLKTMHYHTPTLEDVDIRTIGIDLFSWNFNWECGTATASDQKIRKYSVSMWDFAGQNAYQSAHSLFYSRRTTYLVCVDLKAYSEELQTTGVATPGASSPEMELFFKQNIYKWISAVCSLEPESEFVFIGTKFDLIDNSESKAMTVAEDLFARITQAQEKEQVRLQERIDSIREESARSESSDDSSLSETARAQIAKLDKLLSKRPVFHTEKLHVVSSRSMYGMITTTKELKRLIADSKNSFQMPEDYSKVRAYLSDRMKKFTSDHQRVQGLFADARKLIPEIKKHAGVTDPGCVEPSLHVLHDLGDVLWFDEKGSSLPDTVFTNPKMIIEYIREVINHTLGNETAAMDKATKRLHAMVRNEGRVSHKLIKKLKWWKDLGRDQLVQLKEMLYRFHLAYPDDTAGMMKFQSDLIIPMYCLVNSTPASLIEPDVATLKEYVSWSYEFQTYFPEHLFEMYLVQSYALFTTTRALTRNSFDAVCNEKYHVRVEILGEGSDTGEDECPTLRINVWAASRKAMWEQLKLSVKELEKLLEKYPGLWVVRYVSTDDMSEKLEKLVTQQENFEGERPSQLSALLPEDMTWYTEKTWQASKPRSLKRSNTIKVVDTVSGGLNELKDMVTNGFANVISNQNKNTLATTNRLDDMGRCRDYPALWTLYHEQGTLILKMYSQLSGKCYHEPITIPFNTFSKFVGKYDNFIQFGLTVFTAAASFLPGSDIVEMIAEEISSRVDKAVAVYSCVEGLEIPKTGPVDVGEVRKKSDDDIFSYLQDLLALSVADFSLLKMSETCGLHAAVITSGKDENLGRTIWAHRNEITACHDKNDPQFCVKLLAPPIESQPGIVSTTSELEVPTAEPVPQTSPSVNNSTTSNDASLDPAPPPSQNPSTHQPATLSEISPASRDVKLRIVGAENLLPASCFSARRPYCSWRLVNASGQTVATGQTNRDNSSPNSPSWKSEQFPIPFLSDPTTRGGCTLHFDIMTRALFVRKTIGNGEWKIEDGTNSASNTVSVPVLLARNGSNDAKLTIKLEM